MPYHHGDLRRALLDTALEAVAEHGPVAISLRDIARRAGVSHAAPTHHFRDKTGLLTALAAEGWSLLGDALGEIAADGGGFADLGVGYVVFATSHPAHFAVMRAPGLTRRDDPELVAAQRRARSHLMAGAERFDSEPDGADLTALAGWSMAHGLAVLILEGAVAPDPGTDVAALTRAVTSRLKPAH